jgi:hypothetical protein
MTHLKDTGRSYWQHLIRAWSIAGVLIVHGVFPEVWKDRATKMLCNQTEQE